MKPRKEEEKRVTSLKATRYVGRGLGGIEYWYLQKRADKHDPGGKESQTQGVAKGPEPDQ